ncbi:MAG: alginate export family protein [bacterium]
MNADWGVRLIAVAISRKELRMSNTRRMFLSVLLAAGLTLTAQADDMTKEFVGNEDTAGMLVTEKSREDEGKKPLVIKNGDTSLRIGADAKLEHWVKKNNELLNSKLPDQAEYFKNTFDVILDGAYGEKKFGHKAAQVYVDLRHKGIWGLGAEYANSDATSSDPVKISDSSLKKHVHFNGKPLVWIYNAWLQFSLNAALGQTDAQKIHYLKLGWFPFELGRGIALGSFYGLNREGLGLYSYKEDKAAPGISLSGELLKDVLSYDVYYSKFEERNKSLGYTANPVKEQLLGRKANPMRGVAKDDEVIAARLKYKALNHDKFGTLELEPYIFYNEGSDQTTKITADTKMQLGTVGLGLEYKNKNFEIGGEVAANFGEEKIRALDLNQVEIARDKSGRLAEVFSYIVSNDDSKNTNGKAFVTENSKTFAKQQVTTGAETYATLGGETFKSNPGRITKAYTNKLRGWMGVVDAAYTLPDWNLTLATGYGYASGDQNPHEVETDKTYKGFIGLHELYIGKRIKSIFYDERDLFVPGSLRQTTTKVNNEMGFTNLHLLGFSANWKPGLFKTAKVEFNPNLLFYWKACDSKKWEFPDPASNVGQASKDDASKFVGTEINLMAKIVPIQDLTVFGTVGVFVPGGFYKDVQSVPANSDRIFDGIARGVETDALDVSDYRVSNDTAYLVTVGMKYSF